MSFQGSWPESRAFCSSRSTGRANRTPAPDLELDAIAAVVIGGTSLMGGRGGLAGTFVGVLIFGLLSDILQLQNIDSNVQLLMKGLIIVGTVLVQEQNLGQLMTRWRSAASPAAPARAGSADVRSAARRRQGAKKQGGHP